MAKLAFAIGLVFAAQASLACERPATVAIPNGMTASVQDMRDANAAIQAFMAGMKDYLDCLEAANDQARLGDRNAGRALIEQRENAAAHIHNAAVEDMEEIAAAFEKAVADYKSRE